MACRSVGAHPWTLPEDQSRPLIKQAVESGINFFDTANSYSDGTSEEIVGRALRDFTRRDEVVLATKVYFPLAFSEAKKMPNASGLSRKAIFSGIDASLRRLGTDYIDLYQIHRWDYGTPIEETMEALHDVVKAGKARYIGASSMFAWQFAKALHVAETNGWTRFVTMQNHLNLLYREEEREMLPLCRDEGIGVIPWSPLARGRLTRDWDSVSRRQELDAFGKTLYNGTEDSDRQVVEAVAAIAVARGTAARAGGAGLGASEGGGFGPDRWRVEAWPNRRCGGGTGRSPDGRGNRHARRPLRAACRGGIQLRKARAERYRIARVASAVMPAASAISAIDFSRFAWS